MADDIVKRLLDFRLLDDVDLARLMLDAASEIERLTSIISELLPSFIRDVECGLSIGPAPDEHPDDDCEDCRWYEESIAFKKRIDSGEFGVPS